MTHKQVEKLLENAKALKVNGIVWIISDENNHSEHKLTRINAESNYFFWTNVKHLNVEVIY